MRTKNIIETVTIGIMDVNGDNWGTRLDEIFTTPGWFSLKRVSIKISSHRNELEVALRKLPETQFRRLSSSNSISFDFEVNFY